MLYKAFIVYFTFRHHKVKKQLYRIDYTAQTAEN